MRLHTAWRSRAECHIGHLLGWRTWRGARQPDSLAMLPCSVNFRWLILIEHFAYCERPTCLHLPSCFAFVWRCKSWTRVQQGLLEAAFASLGLLWQESFETQGPTIIHSSFFLVSFAFGSVWPTLTLVLNILKVALVLLSALNEMMAPFQFFVTFLEWLSYPFED